MGAVTAAAIGGAAMLGSSYMGSQAAKKGQKSAEKFARQGAAQFANIDLPDIEKMKLLLESPELVGEYAPELEQALGLGPSSMENVSIDQALEDAQNKSLEGISEIAEGGLTEGDIAAARSLRKEVDQSAQARQKAILSEMAQRGTLGSGMELAARLSANQDAAERQAGASDALTQQAQARALAALGKQGSMAGQMRSQEFGEQSDVARARDAINQFNLVQRANVAQRNIAQQNQAQQQNLAARQAQADAAAAMRNQQQMYNKALLQQQYQNEMQRASGLAGQYAAQGQAAQQAANQQAGMIGSIGSGIGNMAGAYMGSLGKATPAATGTPAPGTVSTGMNTIGRPEYTTVNTATPGLYPNKWNNRG